MKTFILLITLVFLHGCATPPGQMSDDDYNITRYHVNSDIPIALTSFNDGLRYCGGFNEVHNGIPNCLPPRPDGKVICDMYMAGINEGPSGFVIGRSDFIPAANGTDIELRVISMMANNEQVIKNWKMFIAGETDKVCPPYKGEPEDEFE